MNMTGVSHIKQLVTSQFHGHIRVKQIIKLTLMGRGVQHAEMSRKRTRQMVSQVPTTACSQTSYSDISFSETLFNLFKMLCSYSETKIHIICTVPFYHLSGFYRICHNCLNQLKMTSVITEPFRYLAGLF